MSEQLQTMSGMRGSLSSWRAWIEMATVRMINLHGAVALLMESVD